MPQAQLPIFPSGSTAITPELAVERRDNRVVYFNGQLPVFLHEADDLGSFRMFTSQLIINGTATQGQIAKAFGVPLVTIKRSVKRYREGGAGAFFTPTPPRKGSKLTPERLLEVQKLLDEGQSVPQIHQAVGVLKSTLHKAIDDGRLKASFKKKQTAPMSRQR
jgi:transposase